MLVFWLQATLSPVEDQDYSRWQVQVILAALIVHIPLLSWQIVGTVRSADRHFSSNGNIALVWGTQLGATLMFILSSVYVLGAVQMTLSTSDQKDASARSVEDQTEHYSIIVSERELSIEGVIEPGITRAVRQLLIADEGITHVSLTSVGGNVFEARGLSRLFDVRAVTTHVDTVCASACTIAYIGGRVRSASPGAVFGFHQYRMDTAFPLVVTTAESEQSRDQSLFIDAGVAPEFVQIMFDAHAGDMWWPSMDTLQRNRVVHQLR